MSMTLPELWMSWRVQGTNFKDLLRHITKFRRLSLQIPGDNRPWDSHSGMAPVLKAYYFIESVQQLDEYRIYAIDTIRNYLSV